MMQSKSQRCGDNMSEAYKEAYVRVSDEYGWTWKKVKLTGRTKTVSGGPFREDGRVTYYVEVKGLLWNRWIVKADIGWFDPVEEKIYDCDEWRNK